VLSRTTVFDTAELFIALPIASVCWNNSLVLEFMFTFVLEFVLAFVLFWYDVLLLLDLLIECVLESCVCVLLFDVVNFVSLGFGGTLILSLDFVKFNQPGWDLQFIETSYGNPNCLSYPEKVFVEVSKDLINWEYVDIVCLDGYVDVQFTDWFKYIRLTDRSAATKFSSSADGYDVDGVLTIQDCQNFQNRISDYDDIFTPDEETEDILYPNPFNDIISLTTSTEVQVNVMDFAGRRIKSFKATGKFDVSDLKSGYYYFEVSYPDGSRTISKLVKR